jgi:hypothetical protein
MGRIVKLCWVIIAFNYLTINQTKAQPDNDSCANAQVLSVSSSWNYETYTYLSATSDMTGCGDAEDVWFKFEVPSSGLFEIQTDKYTTQYEAYFRLYSGTCGSFTAYDCSGKCNYYSTSNCGSYLRVNDVSLGGDSMYLRVSNRYNFGSIDSFKIAVRELSTTDLEENDECSTAAVLEVHDTFNYTTWSFVYAFVETSASACGNVKDVWFKFEVPSTGVFAINADKYLNQYEPYFRLFTGSCGSQTAYACEGSCDYYSTSNCGSYLRVNDNSLIGDTLYLQVGNRYNFGNIDSFKISVRKLSTTEVHANDSCGAAQLLSVNTEYNYDTSDFKYAFAETSMATCNTQEDVWFKFRVPSSGLIDIRSANHKNQYDAYFRVYTGNCASLTTYDCTSNCNYSSSSNCGSYLNILDTTLANDTLYIRVSNQYSFGDLDSFRIAAKSLPEMRSDTGSYEVTTSCTSVSGSEWIDFKDGSDRIVFSLNPMGENLGETCWGVRVWDQSGNLRTGIDTNENTTYLMHRNFYINPTNSPGSNVKVRLYVNRNRIKDFRDSLSNRGFAVGSSLDDFLSDSLLLTKMDGTSLTDFVKGNAQLVSYTVSLVSDSILVYEFEVSSFSQFVFHFTPGANNAPLPVELLSFRGERLGPHDVVTWVTASEVNSSHFIVEKALDGEAFYSVGVVSAAGNSSQLSEYQFVDKNLGEKVIFYRLKMVDLDGSSAYSQIISTSGDPLESEPVIYPNPFSDRLTVNPNLRASSIQLYTIYGQLVLEAQIDDGLIEVGSKVSAGLYMVKLYDSKGMLVAQERLVKD